MRDIEFAPAMRTMPTQCRRLGGRARACAVSLCEAVSVCAPRRVRAACTARTHAPTCDDAVVPRRVSVVCSHGPLSEL
jgi:hypothetical protein